MLKVSIVLHLSCNRTCPYCYLGPVAHTQQYSDSEMMIHLKKCVKALERVHGTDWIPQIKGGEPTYWSPTFIKDVMKLFEKYPYKEIMTNGSNKDTPWYQDPTYHMMTHIVDWEPDIDVLHQKVQELLPQEHGLIVVTQELLSTVLQYIKKYPDDDITLNPSRGAGPVYDLTEEQVALLGDYVDVVYTDLYKDQCTYPIIEVQCEREEIRPCCMNYSDFVKADYYTGQKPDCQACHQLSKNLDVSETE